MDGNCKYSKDQINLSALRMMKNFKQREPDLFSVEVCLRTGLQTYKDKKYASAS